MPRTKRRRRKAKVPAKPLLVTITKLGVPRPDGSTIYNHWHIELDDGRSWFTSAAGPSRTDIRRAYPRDCARLREIGDTVRFSDTKGFFRRKR